MSTIQPAPSCPNCEYERGSHGRPVNVSGLMKCLDCGNSWKEFGGSGNNLLTHQSRETKLRELRAYAQGKKTMTPQPDFPAAGNAKLFQAKKTKCKTIAAPILAAAMLLGAGLTGLSTFLGQPAKQGMEHTIALGDVSIRERIGRDGKKVITVRGSVENRTAKSAPIPPISIILRQTNGNEIIRWRHASPTHILKAGGKSRFASSIQYDTPAIAYAEALFE